VDGREQTIEKEPIKPLPLKEDNFPPLATPAVRRLAMKLGVDLHQVQRSLGRITEADVLEIARGTKNAVQNERNVMPSDRMPSIRPGAAVPSGNPPQETVAALKEERICMTRRRLTIARRLVEAQHTAAMLTTFNKVDMTAVLDIRTRRKEKFKERHGVGLGFMSFFTKAVVGALKEFPYLNAEIQGEDIIIKYHYDIGIAVATDAGLVVPVVRDADRLSFAEIEQQIADLTQKARNNTLGIQDLQGGTFTITNGGVFGSLFSTPILNAPQVRILGMHTIKQRPVSINGHVEIRPMMYIALTYDHRIVDGSEAVSFQVRVKHLIKDPESLLIEG
jgi:2-oxoglutarate dehydrogenase E2 component (dihydrolipoamide succinyltransferase)